MRIEPEMVRVILGQTRDATTSKITASPASARALASPTSILGPTTRTRPIVILESVVSATTSRFFLVCIISMTEKFNFCIEILAFKLITAYFHLMTHLTHFYNEKTARPRQACGRAVLRSMQTETCELRRDLLPLRQS